MKTELPPSEEREVISDHQLQAATSIVSRAADAIAEIVSRRNQMIEAEARQSVEGDHPGP